MRKRGARISFFEAFCLFSAEFYIEEGFSNSVPFFLVRFDRSFRIDPSPLSAVKSYWLRAIKICTIK